MGKIKISEAVNLLRVSKVSIYKKIQKLSQQMRGHVVNENNMTYITSEGLEILREAFNPGGKLNSKFTGQVNSKSETNKKDELINRLLNQIDEMSKRQAEAAHRSDTIILKLTQDLESYRRDYLQLEYKINAALTIASTTASATTHQDEEQPVFVNAAKADEAREPEPGPTWSITLADFEAAIREAEPVTIFKPEPAQEARKPKPATPPDQPPMSWLDRYVIAFFKPQILRGRM